MKIVHNLHQTLLVTLLLIVGCHAAQARVQMTTIPDLSAASADSIAPADGDVLPMPVASAVAQDSLIADSAAATAVADSLPAATLPALAPDRTHNLKLREVLLPAGLVGLSTLYVRTSWFTKQKHAVQDVLSAKGKHYIHIDDYMQYAPMVAVYGLNLCGVRGQHRFVDRTILLAMSYVTMGVLVNAMKYTIREKRPDTDGRTSFPSGHTATTFMGAEFLWQEYKDTKPWIGYTGYAVAAATGFLRIYNNRHFFNDVIAGACIGMFSTKFAYWLYPKIFRKSKCRERMQVVGLPYYANKGAGLSVSMVF